MDVRHATDTAEREGELAPVDQHVERGPTLGADKGYDVREFVHQLERRGINAHFARNTADAAPSTDERHAARAMR